MMRRGGRSASELAIEPETKLGEEGANDNKGKFHLCSPALETLNGEEREAARSLVGRRASLVRQAWLGQGRAKGLPSEARVLFVGGDKGNPGGRATEERKGRKRFGRRRAVGDFRLPRSQSSSPSPNERKTIPEMQTQAPYCPELLPSLSTALTPCSSHSAFVILRVRISSSSHDKGKGEQGTHQKDS